MANSSCQVPKVSVCMVTYNHVNFIGQAIESVLMQETDFEYELVIGEDCSTDGTREIVKSYAERYPDKIKTLIHPENVGMQQNFLKVLEACRGEYVALLEGDDYWTDSLKLQKQVHFLDKNSNFSICFHKIKIFENNELKDDYITTVPGNISSIEDLAKGNYIHTPSCVFRNRGIEILSEHFLRSPVADYYIHMMNALYGKIYYIDEPMAVYRVHANSAWSMKDEFYKQSKSLISYICLYEDITKKANAKNLENLMKETLFGLSAHQKDILEKKRLCQDSDSYMILVSHNTILKEQLDFINKQKYILYHFREMTNHLRCIVKLLINKIINKNFEISVQ